MRPLFIYLILQKKVMKLAIYTDPQFYFKQNAYESGKNPMFIMLDVLEHIYKQAYEQGARVVLMPGDFVHFPDAGNLVLNILIPFVRNLATKYPDLVTYWIMGNHDYAQGGSLDKKIKNVTVLHALQKVAPDNWKELQLETVQLDTDVYLSGIPFFRHEEHFFKALDSVENKDGVHILMQHQDECNQPPLGRSSIDPEADYYKRFDIVFNGHIHKRTEYRQGTWIMPGIPTPMHEGDEGGTNGWYMLNIGDTINLEFNEINSETMGFQIPRFMYYHTGEEVDLMDTGNYIYRRDKEVEVSVIEVGDDTKEGRTEFTSDFLQTLKQFNQTDDQTEILVEMESVINKVRDADTETVSKLSFEQMQLRGFRSWVNETALNLNTKDLNYIQAPVGSGKSSLFEAIAWCLYGTTLKDQGSVSDVVSREVLQQKAQDFQGTCVSLLITFENQRFEIIRAIKCKKEVHGITLNTGLYIFLHKGKEAILLDNEFFQVSESEYATTTVRTNVVTNYFLKGCTVDQFVNTVYFSSETAKLITGKEADVRKVLEPMFRLEWVEEAREEAKARKQSYELEFSKATGALEAVTSGKIVAERRLEDAKRRVEEQKEKNKADIKETLQKLKSNQDSLKEAEKDLPGEEAQVKELEAKIDNEVNPYTDDYTALRKEYNESLDLVTYSNAVLVQFTPLPLSTEEQRLKQVITELESKEYGCKTTVEKTLRALDRSSEELQDLQKAYETDSHVCSLCGQDYPEGHDHFKKAEEAIESAKKRVADLTKDLHKAKEQLDSCLEQLNYARDEYAVLEKERKAEDEKRRRELEEELKRETQANEYIRARYEGVKVSYTKWDQDREERLKGVKEALNDAKQQVQCTKDYITEVRTVIKGQKEALQKLRAFEPEDIKQFNQDLLDLSQREKEVTQALANWKKKIDIYAILVDNTFTARGLKRQLMGAKLNKINELAKKYVSASGTLIEYSMDEKGKWNCYVNVNQERVPAQTLSTGQATLANLMLVHCLADLQRETLDINLMVLDEPFANMDPEYSNQIKKMLDVGVGEVTKYVITHVRPLDVTKANLITVTGSNVEPSKLFS